MYSAKKKARSDINELRRGGPEELVELHIWGSLRLRYSAATLSKPEPNEPEDRDRAIDGGGLCLT